MRKPKLTNINHSRRPSPPIIFMHVTLPKSTVITFTPSIIGLLHCRASSNLTYPLCCYFASDGTTPPSRRLVYSSTLNPLRLGHRVPTRIRDQDGADTVLCSSCGGKRVSFSEGLIWPSGPPPRRRRAPPYVLQRSQDKYRPFDSQSHTLMRMDDKALASRCKCD